MTHDRWFITHTHTRDDGRVVLRGVVIGGDPFQLVMTADAYAEHGPHNAVRHLLVERAERQVGSR